MVNDMHHNLRLRRLLLVMEKWIIGPPPALWPDELVRRWNDIHLLRRLSLYQDLLHRLKMSLCNGDLLLGCLNDRLISLDLASHPR